MRVADRPVPLVTLDAVPTIARWPVRPVFAVERSLPWSYWDSGPRVGTWDDPGTIWDGGWRDATCSWTGAEIDSGEPDDNGNYPAARVVLQLDNADGSWSTLNTDGTPSDFGPGRRLQIWAHNAAGDWWLFAGRIARYDQRADDTVEIEAFDALSDLAQTIGTYTPGVAGDKAGARLAAILAAAGEAPPTRFAVGLVSLTRQETELAPLEEMQTVCASDGGVMFADADGTLVSFDRTWLSGRTDQAAVPVAAFNVCSAPVHVWDPVMSTNDAGLADRVILENVAKLRAVAGTASGYTLSNTDGQWTTQAEGDNLAVFLLAQQSPRRVALDMFDLYLLDPNQPDLWRAVDWRRLDRIRYLHDQKTVGAGLRRVDITPLIDTIVHTITPDNWTMTVATARAVASPPPTLYDNGDLYDNGKVYEY